MRVHSWGQASGLCGTQALSGSLPEAGGAQAVQSSDCTTQVAFSKQMALIQKLSALQSSDPSSFKQVAGRVAEHFQQRASFAQGADGEALAQLAVSFASAAQTGDMSAFQALNSQPAAPASAPPPPPKPPVDALATALSMVDSITGASSGSASESMQALSELKTSSPAGFKQVMNRVAEGLSQLAHFAEGDDKQALSDMSTRFASAAETGDVSAFAPPSSGSVAPPPAPPAPPPKPPVDALATAFSMVDSISGTSSASSSESVQQLTALKASSPTGFKQLMNRVAEGLSQLANFAEGDDKELLSQMSTRFASVAESGDIASLAPSDGTSVAPPPAPSAPPPKPPVDALATAFSLVDSIAGTTSASSSESVQQLTVLKASSPTGFKQLMNRVAEGLSQLAHFAEGDDEQALSEMSTRFASVAESGDVASFAPASEPAAPPAPPPAPPAPPPVDAVATALSVADELTGTSSASSSESLQKLTDLKASNPAQLKQVMNRVAERLNQLSSFAEGADRDALSQLSYRVASAAESGDLSPFAPAAAAPAEPAPPAPDSAPESGAQAPGAEACQQFRSGYAQAAYRRHCEPAPLNAVDAAYASALSLVNSLTAQNA
jgi:hypothetical protein